MTFKFVDNTMFCMKKINQTYIDAIVSLYPMADNIRTPNVPGSQNNVIYANINGKTHVFKFANENRVRKNKAVSRLFKTYKIPCPEIVVREYNGLFFEEYIRLDGVSLFEAINTGMSNDKIKRIYCEILDNVQKMSEIPSAQLQEYPYSLAHQFAREHVTNVNGATLGQICMALIYMLNIGSKNDIAVFHTDITPKNTIVSNDGHLVGFVDLDSVTISNINFAFGMMAAKYTLIGFDINDLFEYYKKISNKKLNQIRISTIANTTNLGKAVLWKHSQTKNK